MWTELFSQQTLQNGLDLLTSGQVENLTQDGNNATASFPGAKRDFKVRLKLYGVIPRNLSCTCPQGKQKHYCQHMAATLLAVLGTASAGMDSFADEEIFSAKLKNDAFNSNFDNFDFDADSPLDDIFDYIPLEELPDLVKLLIHQEPQLYQTVMDFSKIYMPDLDDYPLHNTRPNNQTDLNHQIARLINSAKDLDFAKMTADELDIVIDPFLTFIIAPLKEFSQKEQYQSFELAMSYAKQLEQFNPNNDSEFTAGIYDTLADFLMELVERTNISEKEKIFSWLTFKNKFIPDNDYSNLIAYLYLQRFTEPAFSKQKITLATRQLKTAQVDHFTTDYWGSVKISALVYLKKPKKEIESFFRQYSGYPQMLFTYCQAVMDLEDYAWAEEILKGGLEIFSDSREFVQQIYTYLATIYETLDDYDQVVENFYQIIIHHHEVNLDMIASLRRPMTNKKWLGYRNRLLVDLADLPGVELFYAQEHRQDLLLDWLENQNNLAELSRFVGIFKKKYATGLLAIYQPLLESAFAQAKTPAEIQNAVASLLEAKKLFKTPATFIKYLFTLQEKFAHKKSVAQELARLNPEM